MGGGGGVVEGSLAFLPGSGPMTQLKPDPIRFRDRSVKICTVTVHTTLPLVSLFVQKLTEFNMKSIGKK
jgi:hypothetical protein